MNIKILGLKKLTQLGKDLKKAGVSAQVSALNKLGRRARKDANRAVKVKYTIKNKTRFGKAVVIERATRDNLVVVLRITDNKPIGYASFKIRKTKKSGVTVQLRKDKSKFKLGKAFIATANQARDQVFIRSTRPGETAKTGYRTGATYSSYQGELRDRVLRPKGPSPNRMMRDVGWPALQSQLDVKQYATDLSSTLVIKLRKKGFR